MTATELKIPISCRVYPELKSEIEEEANEGGLTTSMYLEKILLNRHEPADADEGEPEADFVNVYQYEVEIDELKVEVEMLQANIEKLNEANQALTGQNKSLEEKTQWLRLFNFEEYELEELEKMLEELQPHYPEKSNNQLLLASLHAALKNEDSIFFIHTPSGYFE